MTGIYIHVPFCERKCLYCDFYSRPCDEFTRQKYVDKTVENILLYKDRKISADTVYFGGGTPSLLNGSQFEQILSALETAFNLVNPEITVEANPDSADFSWLEDIKSLGINRISFGVQSADNKELELLGRLHNFETAEKTIENAVKAGFENISADIMTGLPYQDMEKLQYSLEKFVSLPLTHISAYMLKVEEGTPFAKIGVLDKLPDEDTICEMYLETVKFLEKNGFMQYEISNFARNNKYSRHNMKYWQSEEYLGFGPSAHSFFDGKRYFCPDNLEKYIQNEIQPEIVSEESVDKLEEYVMLGLRLTKGIDLSRVKILSDENYAGKLTKKAKVLEKYGLCKINNKNIHLTPEGFLVSNEIIGEFLDLRYN